MKIKLLSETQKAYLAGLIDGEGCLSITKKRDTKGMRYGYCFRPVLHVANTHPGVLQEVQKWTGLGRVRRFDEARLNRKARYQWMVWSNQAAQIVSAVAPYLIIKKKKAPVFLRFVKITTGCRSPGRRGLSKRQWDFQNSIYNKMKVLNL